MKFSIAVNMARTSPGQDPRQVVRQMLELVRLAESGGFEIAWAAEHHTIELMAGPNPFAILMHWAAHTSRIRLGTAVGSGFISSRPIVRISTRSSDYGD